MSEITPIVAMLQFAAREIYPKHLPVVSISKAIQYRPSSCFTSSTE